MKISVIKKLVIPIIAIIGLVWSLSMVITSPPDDSALPPPKEPLSLPKMDKAGKVIVAGTGLIESSSEDISIGVPFSGLISKVFVHEGDYVKKHAPLFTLDTRNARSHLEVASAQVLTAEAELALARDRLSFYEKIRDKAAIAKEELSRRRFSELVAAGHLAEARANFADAEVNLNMHIITAPISGEILQVKVKPGEFAMAAEHSSPLIRMGNTATLHARIDIDEFDIGKLRLGAVAIISPKGDANIKMNGRLIQVEPYVIPKTTVSGAIQELIDTRVLQAVFEIEGSNLPIFPGQQVDAYIISQQTAPMLATIKNMRVQTP